MIVGLAPQESTLLQCIVQPWHSQNYVRATRKALITTVGFTGTTSISSMFLYGYKLQGKLHFVELRLIKAGSYTFNPSVKEYQQYGLKVKGMSTRWPQSQRHTNKMALKVLWLMEMTSS